VAISMPKISAYIREKTDGEWRYRRIKEGRGFKTGDLNPPFFTRRRMDGRQVWKALYAESFAQAKKEVSQLSGGVPAQSRAVAAVQPEIVKILNRIPLATAVETYLEQKNGKSQKTVYQYKRTLDEFHEVVGQKVRYLDEVTENVLRTYKKSMEAEGYAGKTIDTRLNIVFFLLKKNGIPARIPRDEMPVIEEEVAVPYTDTELTKLFATMDDEEQIRYKFFLGSGCRDKEVTFAAWNDIDFDKKTYHVRRKEDVHFTPKSHESRTIPLPDSLIALLKARLKNAPHERWLFINEEDRPDNHFLRKLKRIAKRAALNCGQCRTTLTEGRYEKRKKIEVSCKDRPVCEHFYLHRFRKTCATRWHESGIPIRTIQNWLGHKSLETTMIYLGVTDSEKLRTNINAAFSH
jgi:integrase/recombinase XerD